MDPQGYWQRIEHLYEHDVHTSVNYNDHPIPGLFRPGDIAYTSGGITLAFWETCVCLQLYFATLIRMRQL